MRWFLLSGQPTERGETVLVIEDETVVRGLIVELLLELGYHTLEAIDGPRVSMFCAPNSASTC